MRGSHGLKNVCCFAGVDVGCRATAVLRRMLRYCTSSDVSNGEAKQEGTVAVALKVYKSRVAQATLEDKFKASDPTKP